VNTLSDMCGIPVFITPKRPAGRHDAPSGASFPAVGAEVQYREDAPEVPIFFTSVRMIAAVFLVALLVAYFIIALGVDEYKAIWTRANTSQTQ
jgi:hypothetical protein